MRFLTNLVMNAKRFLGASESTGLDQTFDTSNLDKFTGNMFDTFKSVMKIVMPIVFGVVTAMGVFFAVKLGIGYAQTETTEKREEAKKRLVGAIVGFGIGIVAAALMWWMFTSNVLAGLFE